MRKFDTLIVGHGMAGATLAQVLINRGQRICVVDKLSETSASEIAAGIINPVTGHRLNITSGFEKYYRSAIQFYQGFEQQRQCRILFPLNQVRLLKNQGQHSYYLQRRKDQQYSRYFGQYRPSATHFLGDYFGELEIKESAVVSTRTFLSHSQEILFNLDSLFDQQFDYSQLRVESGRFIFGNICAQNLIFCEGHTAIKNPRLQGLPFKLSKGEIVNLSNPAPQTDFLNWGHWCIQDPVSGTVRLGSTYDWDDLSKSANRTAGLLKSLNDYVGAGMVHSLDVGIRPTTRERIPFVGELSELPNAYCFNGFGSKGCLLIPHYAELLASHLIDEMPIPEELCKWL